ncbi:HIV Tat-specific factor 1 [Agrilus planipennis]|uniref:17S U2 SnRNP complex component HTATSF1 n=1 Tax=Agrilus planipennis TaxID=224129 RepID=A0A1W4WYW9_AGRPL|nr:HIV Tat-specific factor 1 [Agrilus planipennis]
MSENKIAKDLTENNSDNRTTNCCDEGYEDEAIHEDSVTNISSTSSETTEKVTKTCQEDIQKPVCSVNISTGTSDEHNLDINSDVSVNAISSSATGNCDTDTSINVEVAEGESKTSSEVTDPSSSYDPKYVHYEGDVAVYKDPKSGYEYTWNKDSEEWTLRNNENYSFEDDTHTYTDKDGVKYFWDKEKSAWFPKIDDDFMAMYQLNYGFIVNTENKLEESKEDDEEETANPRNEAVNQNLGQKRKSAKDPEWFQVDDQHNTNVYVSNLPLDITEQEFVDFMQKCGLVMRDLATGKMKVKLYTEKDTNILKGDALCTYIKKESVDLALNVLDGYNYKGHKVKVERAKFQMKGEYNPSLKPKRKKKDKEKMKKMQEKLFDWRPEKLRGQRAKHEKVVIIKNAFEPSMFDHDVSLILEIQKDVREECTKCGVVRKVVIFDRHPEGVVQVNMKSAEEADEVIQLVNGRFYNKKQLSAETWDGKTKYRIAETDSEISKRIDKWDKFLEGDEKQPAENEEQPVQKETHTK